MPTIPRKTPPAGRLIGYARASTDEQGTDPQLDELQAAGCAEILEEHASGADRGRPVLARLLHTIKAGDTLASRRSNPHHPAAHCAQDRRGSAKRVNSGQCLHPPYGTTPPMGASGFCRTGEGRPG
jgi:Resolvase, N terminal domain